MDGHETIPGRQPAPRRRNRIRLAASVVIVLGTLVAAGYWVAYSNRQLIEIHHAPGTFPRRAAALTANITGQLDASVRTLEWRLNGGTWHRAGQAAPRTPPPDFTIEIPAEDLASGANELEIRATAPLRPAELRSISFAYDASPVSLPARIEWTAARELDVQDGYWQVTSQGRVRPVPGHEGFDRTIAVTGAFEGGRRVETDVTLRGDQTSEGWGFGIFPLWGGQPDEPAVSPRRGWRFSLLWFFDRIGGYGCEFSEKVGAGEPRWVSMYKGIRLHRDVTYRLVTETWQEKAADGTHLRWRQRCKWWAASEREPERWTEIADDVGARIPDIPYAVALFTLHSQAEFGTVVVQPLAAQVAQ